MTILPEPVRDMLKGDSFTKWLGIIVQEAENGRAVLRMKIRSDMLNGFNICHGGIPFSLADSAMAFASNYGGQIALSIDNSITYHEKIIEGDELTAVAEELSSNRKISVYNVTIKNNKRIVAHFKGVVYKTGKELSV